MNNSHCIVPPAIYICPPYLAEFVVTKIKHSFLFHALRRFLQDLFTYTLLRVVCMVVNTTQVEYNGKLAVEIY